MTDKRITSARDTFRGLILDNYEMDSGFVDTVCEYWTQTVTPLLEASATETTAVVAVKKPRATKAATTDAADKPKQRRKKSAYNVYVREMMKTPGIQALDHKHKMRAIADQWRDLDDVAKSQYVKMATLENDTMPEDTVA